MAVPPQEPPATASSQLLNRTSPPLEKSAIYLEVGHNCVPAQYDQGDITEMLRVLADWIEKRREIRLRWQRDARVMLQSHGHRAYYEAQRLAARARADHDRVGFWHWAKVAAEIARFSPDVGMDMKTVQAIVDEEVGGGSR